MAIFTTAEANASTIVRMEQEKADGVHSSWVFGVKDADGNYLDWKDSTLSSSATKSEIKARILEYLTGVGDFEGIQKKASPKIFSHESIEDKGKGETIG